jgi:hypothetical protein
MIMAEESAGQKNPENPGPQAKPVSGDDITPSQEELRPQMGCPNPTSYYRAWAKFSASSCSPTGPKKPLSAWTSATALPGMVAGDHLRAVGAVYPSLSRSVTPRIKYTGMQAVQLGKLAPHTGLMLPSNLPAWSHHHGYKGPSGRRPSLSAEVCSLLNGGSSSSGDIS